MQEEKITTQIGDLIDFAGDYVDTRIDLLKLKGIKTTSDVASSLGSFIVLILFALFAYFLLNIGAAIWLGELTGKMMYGFFIMAGFNILVAIILKLISKSIIKEPLANQLIKKIYNE